MVSQVSQTCRHDATSLVEMDSKNGPFLTVQCDVCGAVLPQAEIDAPTFAAWDSGALKVAHMDYLAYCGAADRAWRDVLAGDVAGLDVFVRVVRA
jgi:hypothetical protein